MSALFKFVFSCSPGAIRPDKLQRIEQASVPFPVMANQDCNQDKKSHAQKHSLPIRGRAAHPFVILQ